MTPLQQALVERVRAALAAEPSPREVSMFGGRAFMVREAMVVSAGRDGSLLVRVADERGPALLERPGAAPAEMGAGRQMGPGWLAIAADAIVDDQRLAEWVAVALEHNRSMTERTS